jgi:quinol monooxygenase YgiN
VEIVIVGTIEIEPERRAALLEAVRPYVGVTRAEEPGTSHISKYRVDRAEPLRDAAGQHRADFTAQNQP